MTTENLTAHQASAHLPFWTNLAPAWTQLEETARVPCIRISTGAYQVLGDQ